MQHRWVREAALAVLIVGLGFAGPRANASLVLAMDLPSLTSNAERIVVGEIVSVKSAWDKAHERILSTIEVKVAEVWKGAMPGDGRLVIVQPGGTADGIEMKVHGMPIFAAGERAVLFLRGGVIQSQSIVGMGQGKRGLHFDTAAKRWMVDGGDRSAAVTIDAQKRFQHAATEAPLSLDELRGRVSALLKAR